MRYQQDILDIEDRAINKGIEIGIVKGIEQGKIKERRKMIENLLEVWTPIEFIIKSTGLTEEEILKTIQKNN